MNDELGFEHLTKRQLVKFCKKYHKDCYRLVGQKMRLKDQLKEAKQIMKDLLADNTDWTNKLEAEQFLKETE